MSENETEVTSPLGGRKKESPVMTVSLADLQAMVASAVSAALLTSSDQGTKTAQILADALREGLTPKKTSRDLANEENDRMMREQSLEVQERMRQNVIASQEYCQHLQGSNELSEWTLERSSFAMHQLDTGELIGLCTNCQKLISSVSDNPEDRRIFEAQRRKPGNKMSRAGQRVFIDPYKVQRDRTKPPRLPKTEVQPEAVAV